MLRKLLLLAVLMFSLFMNDCVPPVVHYHYVEAPGATVSLKTIPIWIDTQFSTLDKENIVKGIEQWNKAMNGYIKLQVVSTEFDMEPTIINQVMLRGDGWLILKIASSNSIVHDDGSNLTLAFVNEIGAGGNRVYFVRDRLPDWWIEGVTMHEIGHLLGSSHHQHYLMRAVYHPDETHCIDQITLENVAKYQHLPMAHLRYCVYKDN